MGTDCRTSLQVSDVVALNDANDVGASNHRRIGLVFSDTTTSGFEVIR